MGRKRKIQENTPEIEEKEELEEQDEEIEGGIILCDGKYKVVADSHNIILQVSKVVTGNSRGRKTKVENIGKIRYSNIGYFGDPRHALEYLGIHGVKDTGMKDLKIVCDKLDEIDKSIKAIPDNALPRIGGK